MPMVSAACWSSATACMATPAAALEERGEDDEDDGAMPMTMSRLSGTVAPRSSMLPVGRIRRVAGRRAEEDLDDRLEDGGEADRHHDDADGGLADERSQDEPLDDDIEDDRDDDAEEDGGHELLVTG